MKTQANIKGLNLAQAVAAIQAVWPAEDCRISYPIDGVVTIEPFKGGIKRCDVGFTIAKIVRTGV